LSAEERESAPERRLGEVHRVTAETTVSVTIDLDGAGVGRVSTGLPFFDHMLAQLARHSDKEKR
jgi:imidazoleglycerol-phosphate dehydratase